MPLSTQLIFVFCFLCAAAYVLFGILQMVLPARAIPIYRLFLGTRRFAKAEPVIAKLTRWHWRFIGAFYILFGMVVTWVLTINLTALLHQR